MGDVKGFMKYARKDAIKRLPTDRIRDYKEIQLEASKETLATQASRCMNCGVPFCHSACPLGNVIPEFNDAVFNDEWHKAYSILSTTNNFPEFTGRICPAPCEAACVLGINNEAVTIEHLEKTIIEKAFEEGWVRLHQIAPNGKAVAIVGSGPAGLAAADQLNKAGYTVTVYEKNEAPGGLLRFGIPDFKLDKAVVERRIAVMRASGIQFITNTCIGQDVSLSTLHQRYDAVLLCGGSGIARNMDLEGRTAKGIYYAMDFLSASNRFVNNQQKGRPSIDVSGKQVIVLGGGDTGADCVGTSVRQGASSITQIEFMPMPYSQRTQLDPWPQWPLILRTGSSHEEGGNRQWSILTKKFVTNHKNQLVGLEVVDVHWSKNTITNKYEFVEDTSSLRTLPCDVVFLAIGFLHGDHKTLANEALATDERGNIHTQNYHTNINGIFAAGDMRRGQSLVVWAIHEGREAAIAIDRYLMGRQAYSFTKKDVGVLEML